MTFFGRYDLNTWLQLIILTVAGYTLALFIIVLAVINLGISVLISGPETTVPSIWLQLAVAPIFGLSVVLTPWLAIGLFTGFVQSTFLRRHYQGGGWWVLATAVTVTFFYTLLLVVQHRRIQEPYGWFGRLLFLAAAIRLLIMLFPQNQWNNVVPPQPWSLLRNLPLVILGLGVAYLMLRDSTRVGDNTFKWIDIMILVSYAFFAPVILFVQQVPTIGMLMMPKTLAYVAIGFIAYRDLFSAKLTVTSQVTVN